MNWFRGLAGLAMVKWIGSLAMRWMGRRSRPTGIDPGSYPPGGQQTWAPPGGLRPSDSYAPQHQHPSDRPPPDPTPPVDIDDPVSPVSAGQSAQPAQVPPQPYYHPGPVYQQQPPPKPRRRKGCLIFGLIFVALIGVGVMIGLPYVRDAFEDLRDRALSAIGMGEASEPETAGVFPVDDENLPIRDAGVGVRDNQLTFTVAGVECQTGDQLCLVQVVVENTGSEPRHFLIEAQWLIDADGLRHPGVAWRSSSPLPELLVPGDSLEGQIVFAVPRGATATYAQLHESPFTPGALIDLR